MEYGYVRVSTKEQNEDRQIIAMREFGVKDNNRFLSFCNVDQSVENTRLFDFIILYRAVKELNFLLNSKQGPGEHSPGPSLSQDFTLYIRPISASSRAALFAAACSWYNAVHASRFRSLVAWAFL